MLKRIDVIADADASLYAVLLPQYRPERVFGNATQSRGRRLTDITQAIKVKHPLYAVVGHALWSGSSTATRALGLPPELAIHLVNAVISAINLVLFILLAEALGQSIKVVAPLSLLYAGAASPWVLGAVPESWPLSATVSLLFLVMLYRFRCSWLVLGLVAGIGMLNNPFLGGLLIVFWMHEIASRRGRPAAVMARIAASGAIALLAFVGSLEFLSLWDEQYRVAGFLERATWFQERNVALLASRHYPDPSSLDALKGSIGNWLVTAVVSFQSDPFFPVESLKSTLRESWLGRAGVAAYLGLAVTAGLTAMSSLRRGHGRLPAFQGYASPFAILIVVWWLLGHLYYWPCTFLFSPPAVPLLILLLGCYLSRLPVWTVSLVWMACLTVVATNTAQILRIRDALEVMAGGR
ncbi:MAG: hypothetical protein ACKVXR_01415 [Planctomycetota bacterium]